jgi:hypothetical protein
MARKGNIDNLKPWQPGKSANPGGRPSIPEEVKAALQAATPAAVATLVEIMTAGKSEDTRVKAANIILERVYGKARQDVDVRVTDVGAMHLQLLEEIRARRQERLGQAPIDVTPIEKKDEEGS